MIPVMAVFCLRMHEGYLCRHSGVCCSSDWLIPAEPHAVHAVALFGLGGGSERFVNGTGDEDWSVARMEDGSCVFLDRDDGGLCSVHRDAGEQALPTACRHFPREILQDGRGTFISLSHYCPTAAGLLARRDALSMVEALPPLTLEGELDGLDARDTLPPLLRPGVLTDLDGYAAWERSCLATLAADDVTSRQALRLIAGATEELRRWTPGEESLAAAVERAFQASPVDPVVDDAYALLMAQHPPEQSWPVAAADTGWERLVEPHMAPLDYMVKNYLAARLFGNWIVYQSRGLRSIVAWLCTCEAVLRNEIARRCVASGRPVTSADVTAAAGAADLLLIHTIDSTRLGRDFEPLEDRPSSSRYLPAPRAARVDPLAALRQE